MSKDLRNYFPKIIMVLEEVKEEQEKYGFTFEYEIL